MSAFNTVVFVAVCVLMAAYVITVISLPLHGAWRAIRRLARRPKRIWLDPAAFVEIIRLYRPAAAFVHEIDGDEPSSSEPGAYRLGFDIIVNRMPCRYLTMIGAATLPRSWERTSMTMSLMDTGRCAEWDALPATAKAFTRLIGNTSSRGYRGPDSAFCDAHHYGDVRNPAAVVDSLPPRGRLFPRERTAG